MKNIRLLVRGLSLLFAMGLGSNVLFAAQDGTTPSPTGATIEMQIERKTVTKEEAAALVTSGAKINLGVYVIFSKEWAPYMELTANPDVRFSQSNVSWAFYEDEAYSSTPSLQDPSHYLQNPTDYISICAVNGLAGQPASGFCTVPNIFPDDWYASSMDWQQFGWPTFAWGSGFSGGVINISKDYVEKQADGSYKVKIYDLQFILKQSNKNLPIGFLDDINGAQVVDKSNSNCQINPVNSLTNRYWPTGQTGQDWTDLKGTSYFKMTPGGLFIQNGPDVAELEPSFCGYYTLIQSFV